MSFSTALVVLFAIACVTWLRVQKYVRSGKADRAITPAKTNSSSRLRPCASASRSWNASPLTKSAATISPGRSNPCAIESATLPAHDVRLLHFRNAHCL